MNRLLFMGCTAYFLVGLAHVIIGSLLPELIAQYHVNYSNGGWLVFAQFSGFLLGVLLVPSMSARFSKRTTLIIMLVSLGLAQIAYGFLPPWPFMYVIGFIAGLGFGAIEALIGTLIIESIHEKKAAAMSRLEVFFGVGALIMPLIASWMIHIDLWRVSFYIIGLMAFLLALGFKLLPLGLADAPLSKKITNTTKINTLINYTKREKYIMLISIVFFLIYVGSEMSLVNFLPSFLIVNLHLNSANATLSVTSFWATMAIGRIFTGFIVEKVNYAAFLFWSCFGAFIFTVLFAFVSNSWSAYALIMCIGFLMSGLFPIGLIYVNQLLPGKTDKTTSILIASGGVGGAFIPLIVGWIMDHFSVSIAVYFIICGSLALLLMSFIAYRMTVSSRAVEKINYKHS
jgi:FHS family glucose/mannose:H+ symporter-like MFS transporter